MKHFYTLGSGENFYNYSLDAIAYWGLAEVACFTSRRARDQYVEDCVFAMPISYKEWKKFFAPVIDKED